LKFLFFIYILFIAIFLTIVTQVGGIVYLLAWLLYLLVRKRMTRKYWRVIARNSLFIGLYLLIILFVMPPIARKFGRVSLPFIETNHVQPLTIWTALLNRNYVRPELRTVVYSVAHEMNKKYPGTVINYMDAGFPFFDKFPLLPHISHHDGKKLDIAFFYIDSTTGKQTDETPSPIGYGGSEPPDEGEPDRPAVCASQGYWIYSYMFGIIPLSEKLTFDQERTKNMIRFFSNNHSIGKLFLEPHLKVRWHLTSNKIRLHGCNSVRHDDHVHVQLY
jgi:energy-coupling factor transporter transmembrane protein EcfT